VLAPGRKSTRPYGDDHDRVIMRETLFRKVPNPTDEVYQTLNGVIMTCVRFFYNANRDLCLRLGYEVHDMRTYAQVWTANFWSTSRVLMPKAKDENQKLLYRFLRQRFAEFYKQMITFRSRNVFTTAPGEDVMVVINPNRHAEHRKDSHRCDQPRLTTTLLKEEQDDHAEELAKYQDAHTELDVSTYAKRRVSASKMLKSGLESLGHDKLVETLTNTAASYFFCPDTRKEARRQLELHESTCLTCAHAARLKQALVADDALGDEVPVPLDECEDLGVVDPGSGEEALENPLAA
jgi:hypothetical protein